MITQIYSIQTVEEALGCVRAGADCIGIACSVGDAAIPAGIPLETGLAIFQAIDGKATKVALTVASADAEIYPVIEALHPDVIHVCGNGYYATADFAAKARAMQPNLRILQAIPMTGVEALPLAISLASFCDLLILDSVSPAIDGIGAAGFVHDWQLSKAIVNALKDSPCKVILAGGLGADNVADAIRTVRPYGVDSFTRTSDKLPDGSTRKNLEQVAAFVQNAKACAKELGL